MNKPTFIRRLSKASCLVAVILMALLSIEVVVGLTSFYTGGVGYLRLIAFIAVAVAPIAVGVLYAVINRRVENPSLSLFMALGALILDVVLISFANGRL